MTQNEINIIKNAILDSTEAYVEAKLGMSDFVKTQIGVIHSYEKKNNKYYHTVKCDNGRVTYNNVLSIGTIMLFLISFVPETFIDSSSFDIVSSSSICALNCTKLATLLSESNL